MSKRMMMILAIVLLALFAISQVSAADNLTSDISSTDKTVDYLNDVENQPVDQISDGEVIKQTDNGTFSALNEKISKASENSVVYLENDYSCDADSCGWIYVDKSITIDGQGHKIDAKNNLFVLNIDAFNVTVKNTTFLNAKNGNVGVIRCNGDGGKVLDCVFSDNYAYNGDIIDWYGDNGTVSGCTFLNNFPYGCYVIDFHYARGIISDCVFKNNSAYDGGIISMNSVNCIVLDCVFLNNSIEASQVIVWSGDNGTVSGCVFLNNSIEDESNVIRCTFADNCLISRCTFINNTSDDGNIINMYYGSGLVSGCAFIQNNATYLLYNLCEDNVKLSKITNNIFLKNDVNGSLIFNNDSSLIEADFNWFGNAASDLKDLPVLGNVTCDVWLFLNAAANPNMVPLGTSSDVRFKLYAYNKTSQKISDYDNSLLMPIELKITTTNGNVDRNTACLGDSIRFSADHLGQASVSATFENIRVSVDLTIIQTQTKITAPALKTVYGKNKNLIVSLTDDKGTPIRGEKIIIQINGKKTYTTDKNGQVKVKVGKLIPKTYKVKIAFAGGPNFKPSQKTVKVTVTKAKAKITAKKRTFKAAKKVKKYTVTLKSGKLPIKKVKLTLKINGKTFKAKTNKKGKATFKLKLNKKGNYNAVIKFKANKYYKKATKKVKIKIK